LGAETVIKSSLSSTDLWQQWASKYGLLHLVKQRVNRVSGYRTSSLLYKCNDPPIIKAQCTVPAT